MANFILSELVNFFLYFLNSDFKTYKVYILLGISKRKSLVELN